MQIVQVSEDLKQHWDSFVKTNAADGGLLQSWAWGDFQKSLDNKVFRLALVNGSGQIQAVILVVKHELHFEYNYLYCPRGPVINVVEIKHLNSLFAEIKNIAKEDWIYNFGPNRFLYVLSFSQSFCMSRKKENE